MRNTFNILLQWQDKEPEHLAFTGNGKDQRFSKLQCDAVDIAAILHRVTQLKDDSCLEVDDGVCAVAIAAL